MGSRLGLDAIEKSNILHCRDSNSEPSDRVVRFQSLYLLRYPDSHVFVYIYMKNGVDVFLICLLQSMYLLTGK
jgi:hypothetical protein